MGKTKFVFLILMLCLVFISANNRTYALMRSDMDPKEAAEMVKKRREASKIKLRQTQLEKQEAAAELENSRKIEKIEDIQPLSKKKEDTLSSVNSSSIKTLVILLFTIIITFGLLLAVLKAKKRKI